MLWQAKRERKDAAEVAPNPLCAPALEYPEYPQITPEAPREYPEYRQSASLTLHRRALIGSGPQCANTGRMQRSGVPPEYPESTPVAS